MCLYTFPRLFMFLMNRYGTFLYFRAHLYLFSFYVCLGVCITTNFFQNWFPGSSLDYFVQCSSNFLEYGANLTLTSDYFNVSGVSLSTCQQLCSNDSSCVSFHHQQNTSECRLSKSSSSVSTICVSCTYQTKQCSQGTCNIWFLNEWLWKFYLFNLVLK